MLASPARAQEIVEPRSGAKFQAKTPEGDMSLLGVGLRTRTFLKVKVYAIGLYVADEALSGPLAAYKGKAKAPLFYRDLLLGDFRKQVVLKFVRDVSADQIRGAFREALTTANKARVEQFLAGFTDIKTGQECVLKYSGGALEPVVAGQPKPPINDKDFAVAVFGIWLGDKPIQEDIKKELVARASELIR